MRHIIVPAVSVKKDFSVAPAYAITGYVFMRLFLFPWVKQVVKVMQFESVTNIPGTVYQLKFWRRVMKIGRSVRISVWLSDRNI